jgi:nicotinamide riboside transporter PnuC
MILSLIATILSLLGNFLIIKKKRIGFISWIISNILWIIVNLISIPNIPQIIMFLVYTGISIYGWIKWKQN